MIKEFIKKNRIEVTFIIAIILIAAFFRLYQIDKYMTFLGDEGRDALVVKKILILHDFPLLGPPTSIGNMYLGPLYYYMMAVPMAFFWMNPVAAAVMVAIIGIVSVGLVYYLSREWFGKQAAIVASLLYAVSPVLIIYSRSSWNPNPAHFFALLGIFSLYKLHKSGNGKWLLLTGLSTAFAIQMHYLALMLVPIYGVLWGYEFFLRRNSATSGKVKKVHSFILGTVGAILIFLFLMSPLAIFDYLHNGMNYKAISAFFSDRQTTVNLNIFNTLGRISPIYMGNLIERLITDTNLLLKSLVSILVLVPIGWGIFQFVKFKKFEWPLLALNSWLIIGVLGLALYKQTIYDHYLGFLYPVPFLLLGALVHVINTVDSKKINQIIRGLFILLFLILIGVNINRSPLKQQPNSQLQRTQQVSRFVIAQTGNKDFNFALLAKSNYDAAYQFYLDQYGHPPKNIPFQPYIKTNQLFVVCEDNECKPVGNAKEEIARFGWTKIEWVQNIYGVKIFKLIPNPEQNHENH